MLTRELKLKLNNSQVKELNSWLLSLRSLYNWGIRKIELNANNKVYFSKFDFQNLLTGHSKKLGIPSHVIQATLLRSYLAWQRCFNKISKRPKLKSFRCPIRSIPFPDPIKQPFEGRIGLLGLGKLKFFKQQLPTGKIKQGRIIKRASGWYLQLIIDANHQFPVQTTNKAVGIDTGFKQLLTLSDGTVFENPKELTKGANRLAQTQRGNNKKLIARLHERQSNRRKDRNHKISREIVEEYSQIYITNDNLKGQAAIFGRSVGEAAISQLRSFLAYKSLNSGREFQLVASKNTTRTCSACQSLTGPTGLAELKVRHWVCGDCGSSNERDLNAARNILAAGLGCSLESAVKHVGDC